MKTETENIDPLADFLTGYHSKNIDPPANFLTGSCTETVNTLFGCGPKTTSVKEEETAGKKWKWLREEEVAKLKHSDYLKKKKTRETRKRIVSVIAAIVVFVTTYALVLPAITLDVSRAGREPGIAFEQMQFKTTASAASVTAADSTEEEVQVEEPAAEEPAEEETVKEEPAESSEEETSAASDTQKEAPAEPEEAEEVEEIEEVPKDQSSAGEADAASSSESDSSEAQNADTQDKQEGADQAGVDQSGTVTMDTADTAATAETAAEFQIPALDALDFDDILTGRTNFYYYHPANAEEAESLSSDTIDDWKKVGSDTVLAPEDFVRVYLSYEIPAGALNETNAEARYRLPACLELSDMQIKAINKFENGIAASKSGSERDRYLGAEAIEGSRTPDETAGDEYISATVKVENTGSGRQDLVFTFIPYTVEKNQIAYDEKGQVTSRGQKVKGFFTFDLPTSQIDFEKTGKETVEKEDGTAEEIQYSEAEVVFAEENNDKNIDEISRTLTMAAPAGNEDPQTKGQKSLTSKGSDYTVIVSYTDDAQIPDNAELSVREIEKGTDEYASYLKQAESTVDETKSVNEARFFDITILADGEKIEPKVAVSVQINFTGIEQTDTDDTQLLHYKDDKEVEIMDEAEFSKSEEQAVDTVQFETDGFSVYGIVGTGTMTTVYITAEGETYTITVTCGPEAGIPEDAELYVEELMGDEQAAVESALDAIRSEETRVAVSRTFDIKILDAGGNEIQPVENATVEVSFELAETENRNLDTNIYHMTTDGEEVKPQQMEVETKDGVATVVTDGFSYYTVEFTYNNLTYVLNGDETVALSEIMDYVGLSGEVTGVEVSDETLFMASDETGEWQVSTLQPFSTDEWMKVTVDNIDFEITFMFKVTDAVALPPIYSGGTMNGVKQYGEPNTFLHMCEEPTIIILPDRVNVPDSVTVSDSRFRQEENKISYHGTLHYYSVNAFNNGQKGICTLLYKNAALLQDGSFADVQIKVTEARYFTKNRNSIGGVGKVPPETYPSTEYYLLQWDPINGTRVLSGSSVTEFDNLRVGLEASLEISIVRNGSKVEGSFYYGMTDIDVSRVAVGSMAGIYESAKYIQFSEQVEIVSGAASVAYIPVSGGNSSLYDGLYCCGISNNTGSDANGLLFTPGNEQGDVDPGTFCSGFALLANANGLNIKVRSAGGQRFTVNTTVSPPPIGSLYLRKNVIKGTKLDYQRNWNIKAEIGGSSFEDDQMKHGETVYVGAFMQGLPFTAKEIMPHDWVDYDISWKVLDGVTGNEVSTGESASASGTILPRTIVEFENERLWVEDLLTIKKVVLNPGEGDQQKDWWFTVTLTDGSGDDVLPIRGLREPDSAQNWTEVGNGKYRFTLKDGEMIQITLPKGCNYAVEEDEYPEYYTVYDHQRGSLPKETVATVKNMPKPDITVLKVDKNDQPLAEARFKLFRKNESGSYVQVVPSTGSGTDFDVPKEGYVIENLDSGEYKLIETLAPKGYIILSSDFEFTLNVDSETGFYTITPVSQREDVVIDNTRLIITVSNTPGVALPNTGGPGTLLYTLSGIALMLGAALMYGFRMRLRERRLN